MAQSVAAAPAVGFAPRPGLELGRKGLWAAHIALLAGLIGALDPLPLAIGVVGSAGALLVLRWPLLGIGLLLFAVPFGSLAQVELGSFQVGPTEVLTALVGLSWLLRGIAARRIRLMHAAPLTAAAMMSILALFSITYAIAAGPAIKETLKWLELAVVVVVMRDLVRTWERARPLVLALFVAASLEALYGVFQFATNAGPVSFALGESLRAYGNFEQPNPFGGYLSTVLPVALAVALAPGTSRTVRWTSRIAVVCLALGIALSQSRGAWLGLAVAFVVAVLVLGGRARLLLGAGMAALLATVLAAFAGLLPASIVQRVSQAVEYFGVFDVRTVELTSENWAVVERMAHWQAGWGMFLDNPWLGVGAGNYPEAYPFYYINDWLDPLGHAHNYYINTLAELGVVGLGILVLFLTFVFATLFHAARARLGPAPQPEAVIWRLLGLGILASFVVFNTHNIFDNLFVHSVNVQIGFLLALGLLAAERVHAFPEARPEQRSARI
ncbi:MAG: O-antigen ligase family protein [Chloroflexi bacterium]|nr:O-antigen ligase family protein [Chloroflexota bacterium]